MQFSVYRSAAIEDDRNGREMSTVTSMDGFDPQRWLEGHAGAYQRGEAEDEVAMTVEQSAAEAAVRIGPVLFSWKWTLAGTAGGLSLSAQAFAHSKPWLALPWLVLSCLGVVLRFVVQALGVDLTPEAAVIQGWRRRRVPWPQVQSVVNHVNSNGTSAVQLILANGEPVTLPFPKTLWRKGDAPYERDLQRIDQWWLAHRGDSWRPTNQEERRPPAQG